MTKLGIKNFIMIGTMALLFIVIAKVVFTKFPVKGVTDVVLSA